MNPEYEQKRNRSIPSVIRSRIFDADTAGE